MTDGERRKLGEIRHAAEMLAMYAQNLLAFPESPSADAWRANIAMLSRRIAEIAMPQDLRYTCK